MDEAVPYSTQPSRMELGLSFNTNQQDHQWSMSPPRMTPRMVHAGRPSGTTSPGLESPDQAMDTARSAYAAETSGAARPGDGAKWALAMHTHKGPEGEEPPGHMWRDRTEPVESTAQTSFSEFGKVVEDIRRYRESPVPGLARTPPPMPGADDIKFLRPFTDKLNFPPTPLASQARSASYTSIRRQPTATREHTPPRANDASVPYKGRTPPNGMMPKFRKRRE